MKYLNRILFFAIVITVVIAGCKKVADLPMYNNGNAVTLSASSANITPTPADSSSSVVEFSWTDPKYATDEKTNKYVIEIDSAGRNFVNKNTMVVIGDRKKGLTGTELNNIVLNYGFSPGKSYKLDVRVLSSYGNNNETYTSNTLTLNVTPYADPSMLTSDKTGVVGTSVLGPTTALTFSWSPSFKGYMGAITYALEYDSLGKNFTSLNTYNLGTATSSKEITYSDLNETAIAEGILPGKIGKVSYRIKAMTALGAIAYSNAVTVNIKTYPPAPANLFIVGDATPGGWNNPVPTPSQQFTKIDANTFSINIALTSGKSYLLLPVNGDWSHKYGGATNGTSPSGGILLKDGAVPGSNTPSPATSGIYTIVVNFLTNKYTVSKLAVPTNLYIVGDATAGGWGNPVPTPSQQFVKLDDVSFGIVLNLTAAKSYLLLPVNGDWSHKFGGATDGTSASGGTLLADGLVPGTNTPSPGTSGVYKIIVNFATNKYTVSPYDGPANLFIVGDATSGGWANPVPVPSQQFTQGNRGVFVLTLPLTSTKSYLLLPVNGDWTNKYGGATDGVAAEGDLLANGSVPGSNTPAPATSGTKTITVNFITMKYKVQ